MLRAVGSIVGVQAVSRFPTVGYAVAISIGGGCLAVERGPCRAELGNEGRVIVLSVDDTTAIAAACCCCCTIAGVADHLFVEGISVEACTGILQHFLVGLFSGVSRHGHIVDGLRNPDGVLGDGGEGTVVTRSINLLIDSHVPLVSIRSTQFRIIGIHVARYIIFSPDVPGGIVGIPRAINVFAIVSCADTGSSNAVLIVLAFGGSSGLVVVVHDVHFHGFAAVATIAAIVIDDIVAHVHAFIELCGRSRAKSWGTAVVVSQQVVMVAGTGTAPVATVAVRQFGMSFHHALSYEAPLYGDILAATH